MFFLRRVLPLLGFVLLVPAQAVEEMQTRFFRVPPMYLQFRPPAGTPLEDVRPMLTKEGISFPPGAVAYVDPVVNLLQMTNTAANQDLTQRVVDKMHVPPAATVAFLVTVVEGPAELIRQVNDAASAGDRDATPELARLLDQAKTPDSRVRIVADCFLESRTALRGVATAGLEQQMITPVTPEAPRENDNNNTKKEEVGMGPEGLLLLVDPLLGRDNKTIDSEVELRLHPTVLRSTPQKAEGSAELRSMDFKITFAGSSGQTRLLGVGRPEEKDETVLWAAFVTATIRRIPAPEMAIHWKTEGKAAATPAELETAVFQVPEGLFEAVVQEELFPGLRPWLEREGVAFGAGAQVSHEKGVLCMTNTPLNLARTALLVEQAHATVPRSCAFTLHTWEAPAALARDLARQTVLTPDDAAMLAALQAAGGRGEARCVDFMFLAGSVNEFGMMETGHQQHLLCTAGMNEQGLPVLNFSSRHVGSDLRFNSSFSHHYNRLETSVGHEIHTAATAARRGTFTDATSRQSFDLPESDFHRLSARGELCLPAEGGTRLVSMQQPIGRGVAATEKLWVTLVRCDAVQQILPPDASKKAKPIDNPQGWETRLFHVPPGFLLVGTAAGEQPPGPIDLLKAEGIPFPEGATATFDREAASFDQATIPLEVRNTRENLALLAEHVDTLIPLPAELGFHAEVLQAPGPLLRRLASAAAMQNDHRALLDELHAAVQAGTAQSLATTGLQVKPGYRTAATPTAEHDALTGVGLKADGTPVFTREKQSAGLALTLEPTLHPRDDVRLWLEAAFDTAAPQERTEHVIFPGGRRVEFPLMDRPRHKVETRLTMRHQGVRLVSMWKPTGKAEFEKTDVLQVMFITCDVVRDGK